jgi:hypothetical protein
MRSTIPAAPAYGVYISQTIRYSRSLWLLSGLPVEDISLLFGINMAGDKVIMAPIIFPRSQVMKIMYYRNRGIFPACSVTLAMKKPLEE